MLAKKSRLSPPHAPPPFECGDDKLDHLGRHFTRKAQGIIRRADSKDSTPNAVLRVAVKELNVVL